MGARGPTNNLDPSRDCVDVSAAGREQSRSYHRLNEVPGRPTTEIDSFMVGAWVPNLPIDLLPLTLGILCVLSLALSLPSLLLIHPPEQTIALCTSIDAALAHLSSSDYSGEPGHGLNETGLKLVVVHFLLAHPGTPSLFTLLPCPPGPPGHISHLCGSPIHFPDRVTNINSEMPVAVQPPDSGGGNGGRVLREKSRS
jgi:hypothetical protein